MVKWLHETLLLAATILPYEYFPTCLKACNYCSVLHAVIAHETVTLRQRSTQDAKKSYNLIAVKDNEMPLNSIVNISK